jgi:hypothetical protein
MLNLLRISRTLFFIAFFCLWAGQAHAQEAGIKLVPATIEKAGNPGDVIAETLTVTNVSGEEKEYFLYVRNITGVGDGGSPIFAEENTEPTGYEIVDWVELQLDPIRVPAGGELQIPITIRIPDTASPGSHFGGVFISAEPPRLRQMGAGVGYEVASILSIRINGDIIDDARIRSLSSDRLFYGSKNVNFVAKIENQGNILIRPRGPLTITSMFGGDPVNITVNDSLAGIFPGTVRDLEFSWNDDGIGFGRYEAVLALSYEGQDGQKTIDASHVFWVFPIKIMLPLIIGFLSVILVGYLLTRYYIHQAVMRAAGGRRISPQRYRRQVGVSRFTFVLISLMGLVVLFLIVLLVVFA